MKTTSLGLLASMLLAPGVTMSATFTVDTTQGGNDALLRVCDPAVEGDCSFHGALERVNANADADTIAFGIDSASDSGCVAATGVCRVFVPVLGNCNNFSDSFVLTSPLVIDGLTQPGSSANTLPADGQGVNMQVKIELARTSYCRSGLRFQKSATVRGVAIIEVQPVGNQTLPFLDFAVRDGVEIYRVESSIIGGFADGSLSDNSASIFNPIRISDCFQCLTDWRNEAHIGGELPAQRNHFVSGAPAIDVRSNSDSPNQLGTQAIIKGNLFGTTRSGNAVGFQPSFIEGWINVQLGNDAHVQVGGAAPAARNVFTTTVHPAISPPPMAFSSTTGAETLRVQGNYFGLGADGTTPLQVRSAMYNFGSFTLKVARATIGGVEPGEGNRFVSLYPTYVIDSQGSNTILGNEFIGTISLALVEDPARPSFGRVNDPGDADQFPGSGDVQNWPEISAFQVTGDQLALTYRVDSLPANSTYPLTVEFFMADANNATRLLGRDTYALADAAQPRSVVLPLAPGHGVDAESMIIAIANQPAGGGVSSFSWAPALLSFTGNAPATVNVASSIAVRMQSPGPFRPRGRVEISDSPGNPLATKCIATLVPSATSPYRAEGACSLTWQQVGSRTLTATYLDLHESFHSSSGDTPTAGRQIEITAAAGEMLCDGFEQPYTCRRPATR